MKDYYISPIFNNVNRFNKNILIFYFSFHNKHMEPWILVILITLSSLLLLLIVALVAIYFFIYYSPFKKQLSDFNLLDSKNFRNYEQRIKDMIVYLMNIPYEDVYIHSFDKTKLHARLYENKKTNKVAILCHGYRGASYRDFSGGGREFIEMGYNVLLIDERAHGKSQSHNITFGIKETKDVLEWINYAKERFGQDIDLVLVGISMGGATVLNLADKVDENVKIIADCPYASIKEMFKKDIKMLHLPVFILYPLLWLSALLFVHININKFDNYQALANRKSPILIVHGSADTVVPFYMSQKLYETYPNIIKYELFEGAEHGVSFLSDPNRYRQIVKNYLEMNN